MKPHVTYDEDTWETTLEWWFLDRKITITVDPREGGGVSALKVWGPNIHEDMEEVDLGGQHLFKWLKRSGEVGP